MKLYYVVCSLLFLSVGCSKENVSVLPPTELFEIGKRVPIEVIYYESEENERGRHYLSSLTLTSKNEGKITISDTESQKDLAHFSINLNREGVQGTSTNTQNSGLNEFVFQNYSEWCGRWHHGRRFDWQFCTGDDCKGEGSVRWCIKRRER